MPPTSTAHFALAWDKYRNVMCDGFSSLQQNGEFVDMTIAADGHLVKVHQMIIGLASPYLRELIHSAPCPHPVIFLNNVSHQMLCSILEYVYTGEVAVAADKLTIFIETAKALHIKGLEDMLQPQECSLRETATPAPQLQQYQETITVQAISKPGTGTVQLQVVGEKPSEMVLPLSARNIVVKRNMPIITPALENSKQGEIEEPLPEIHYMDEDDGIDPVEQIEHEPATPPTVVQEVKVSTTPAAPAPAAIQQGDLQYTVSNRGALQLILNRYMYNLTSRSRNGRSRRWKCVDYRNNKCPAVATTDDNVVTSRSDDSGDDDMPSRFWRCVDYRHKRCPASIYTFRGVVTNRIAMHNHAFHDKRIMSKIERKAVFSAIKQAEEASLNTEDMIDD